MPPKGTKYTRAKVNGMWRQTPTRNGVSQLPPPPTPSPAVSCPTPAPGGIPTAVSDTPLPSQDAQPSLEQYSSVIKERDQDVTGPSSSEAASSQTTVSETAPSTTARLQPRATLSRSTSSTIEGARPTRATAIARYSHSPPAEDLRKAKRQKVDMSGPRYLNNNHTARLALRGLVCEDPVEQLLDFWHDFGAMLDRDGEFKDRQEPSGGS